MTRRTKQTDPPGTAGKETDPAPSFEESLEELESIVQAMDGERMPLDELLQKYERGMRLLKTCQASIEQAQQRVEMITAGKNGASLEPFAAGNTAPPPPAPASPDSDEIRLF